MTYHTFIQYNNGLLQDFIDKFKPRTAISSTSKCQNKYIFRQTSPKRPSQAKENPNEKNFNTTNFLQERISILFMVQSPLYIYDALYSAIHIIPYTD